MVNYRFNQNEIKTVWKHTKNKRYSIQSFISNDSYVQYIIFKDLQSGKKCTGKVVTKFLEGEVYHWPRLHHSSLAPLLDIIYIDERIGVYMTTHLTRTLRETIHNDDFANDPLNFDRKKAYVTDILWGLDYIHSQNLSLMNISDANVFVYPESDKAIIANFNCLVMIHNAAKHKKCAPYMYRAPELSSINPFGKKNVFDPIFTDIWSIGVMIMEIFLSHTTPWGLVDYNPSRALEVVNKMDCEMLQAANKGSYITTKDVDDFKKFLGLFLNINPQNRSPAHEAVLKDFIQIGKYRVQTKTVDSPDKSLKKLDLPESDKLLASSSKSLGSPIAEFEKVDPYTFEINRNPENLKETFTRYKLQNTQHTSSADQSSWKSGKRSHHTTNHAFYPTNERSNVVNNVNNVTDGPKSQIEALNEIQGAALNLSLKLCKYYKDLENESNTDKKEFLANNSALQNIGSLYQLDENFKNNLHMKNLNAISNIPYTDEQGNLENAPYNNKQGKSDKTAYNAHDQRDNSVYNIENGNKDNTPHNGEQDKIDSFSDITESNDSNSDEYAAKRFSEPRLNSSANDPPKGSSKLFQVSAPVLRNLTSHSKQCNLQQTKETLGKDQIHQNLASNQNNTLDSKTAANSRCRVNTCDKQSGHVADENTEVGQKPILGDKNLLNQFDTDRVKYQTNISKDKQDKNAWKSYQWSEETKSPKTIKFLGPDSINYRKNNMAHSSYTERKRLLSPEIKIGINFNQKDKIEQESFRFDNMLNLNGSNTASGFNSFSSTEIIPRFFSAQPRQIKIAKRRLNYSHNNLNENKFYKTIDDAKKYKATNKQTCQNDTRFKKTLNVIEEDCVGLKPKSKKETQLMNRANVVENNSVSVRPKSKNVTQFQKTANVVKNDCVSVRPKSKNFKQSKQIANLVRKEDKAKSKIATQSKPIANLARKEDKAKSKIVAQLKQTADFTREDDLFKSKIKNEKQLNETVNIIIEDNLNTKQKCELSKALINEAKKINEPCDQEEVNIDKSKKKKEKTTTCFCFSKK